MKYKCPCCETGIIVPVSKSECKCTTGCSYNGNTKQLIEVGVITHYINGDKIENLSN